METQHIKKLQQSLQEKEWQMTSLGFKKREIKQLRSMAQNAGNDEEVARLRQEQEGVVKKMIKLRPEIEELKTKVLPGYNVYVTDHAFRRYVERFHTDLYSKFMHNIRKHNAQGNPVLPVVVIDEKAITKISNANYSHDGHIVVVSENDTVITALNYRHWKFEAKTEV